MFYNHSAEYLRSIQVVELLFPLKLFFVPFSLSPVNIVQP